MELELRQLIDGASLATDIHGASMLVPGGPTQGRNEHSMNRWQALLLLPSWQFFFSESLANPLGAAAAAFWAPFSLAASCFMVFQSATIMLRIQFPHAFPPGFPMC